MEIRKVSSNSQLKLPKEFAGKMVSIDKIADNILQIKLGRFIPDSETIFHTKDFENRLKKFDKWMDTHEPHETDIEKLCNGKK